jgi:hypothetical protein
MLIMNKVVDEYIAKQASPQKEICQELRQVIFRTFPAIKEEMKWGVPTYDNSEFYLVALKNHVNLGFSLKGMSSEEKGFFEGSGKTMKHIKVKSLNEIDESRIVNLLKLVKAK